MGHTFCNITISCYTITYSRHNIKTGPYDIIKLTKILIYSGCLNRVVVWLNYSTLAGSLKFVTLILASSMKYTAYIFGANRHSAVTAALRTSASARSAALW